MLGDGLRMVHLKDERYAHLIGIRSPLLCDRNIPIIANALRGSREARTGVKVTPAHDFNDYYAVGQRQFPQISILTLDAKINEHALPNTSTDRFDARKAIVDDLEGRRRAGGHQAPSRRFPRGDRTGVA